MRTCSRCGKPHERTHSFCSECIRQYNRDWSRANPGRRKRAGQGTRREVAAWRAANPEKKHAHDAVYRAIKIGKLTRPGSCEHCGIVCRPQAHHDDYERRLDVTWLCSPCHMELHAAEEVTA